MKRARLVVVDDEKRDLEALGFEGLQDAPTCATCRWAEETRHHSHNALKRHYPLCCARAKSEGGEAVHADSGSVAYDVSDFVGELYVKPTFGCVQWEGRE